jgi:hypothetical protein
LQQFLTDPTPVLFGFVQRSGGHKRATA